jgi:hypothetical protein
MEIVVHSNLGSTLAGVGLLIGLIGSLILAASLNRVIQALVLATEAHDFALEGLFHHGGPVVRVAGTDAHVQNGLRHAKIRTRIGFGLLAVSFLLQGAGLIAAA